MRTMTCLILFLPLLALANPAVTLWEDGEAEVVLGAYFDEGGTDSTLSELKSDTLTVYLVMWNGSLRGEGPINALEYRVELPEGLLLLKDELPEYSKIAIGDALDGMAQTIVPARKGDGLLINTLHLRRTAELPGDAIIRIVAPELPALLQYVSLRVPENFRSVEKHRMLGGSAVINPLLSKAEETWKPVRSE
ncbi:MAG: hypothetical protein QF492_01495 [Candidatus Krumholzibacteria bacterium]|jgi:hypothetical protein|nr:hypothetical protein [Candidatus Krumholzibacteria bacterium]MDP6668567.1 hypothetical protein [Candidatus Krumholzibacteria bacterium]MDP6796874.1 hypothetical protein [Candidatus Krumholzibacteria bacterium]MDP7021819.1 hypothetical protein [Candidatus Krumholzibacteria bacterium]